LVQLNDNIKFEYLFKFIKVLSQANSNQIFGLSA
jgi:hypothetical protein